MAVGHSSHVQIVLEAKGRTLRVAQVGEDSLILRDAGDLPPCTSGRIVIVVDGHVTTHPILLEDGVDDHSRVVRFRNVGQRLQPLLFCDDPNVPF